MSIPKGPIYMLMEKTQGGNLGFEVGVKLVNNVEICDNLRGNFLA